MVRLLAVGLGGALGAIARYGVSGLVHRWWGGAFPIGTLAVNVIGCLIIGGLMTLIEDRPLLSPEARLFLTIGLLGSFTTFSTVGYETFEMLRDNALARAALNLAANVFIGLLAVWAGRVLVRTIGV